MLTVTPTASPAAATIDSLRAAVARIEGEARQPATALPPLATGLAAVDALLAGGLPRGRLSEISGARSSGKASLALSAAARATQAGLLVAWVDGPGELYPPAAAAMGVDLSRLLIVRPGRGADAMDVARAGEIVAKSRAFALVVLDHAGGAFPERAAARLRAAAHEAGVTVAALTARAGALAQAHAGLEVRPRAGEAWAPGARAFAVRARRGGGAGAGAGVGTGGGDGGVEVRLGDAQTGSFRAPERQLELRGAAAAIRPVRAERRRS